jgi:hypothetical protein
MPIIPRAQADLYWQETSLEMVCYDGCHPQIHPSIITLHTKLVTAVQQNGSFKEVYSMNGNLLVRFCGYTGNVRDRY